MGMTHGADRVREARASRARHAAVVAMLVGAALLAGCATGGSGSWLDRALGRTSAQGSPHTSYAAVAAKVYSEPDAGSTVMGVLARHEELRSYQSDSGFVYVEAAGNLSGWVPKNQLVARRPVSKRAADAPAESAAPSAPENEATPSPTETTPEAPDAETQAPERSVFDPYSGWSRRAVRSHGSKAGSAR